MGSALSDYRHPDRSKMYVSLRSTLANNHLNAASKGKKISTLKKYFFLNHKNDIYKSEKNVWIRKYSTKSDP